MIKIPKNFVLSSADTPFANVELALKEPNGLVALGGELTTHRLLEAYRLGIFPWYGESEPVLWYAPDPRMVITLERLHISKSLNKTIHSDKFEVKVDTNFERVIHHCKTIQRKNQNGTWINNDMVRAYTELHLQGFAHSVEVYEYSKLVGGLYGVALGQVFFGESMFSLARNASKIAFVHLLTNMPYKLVDCQVQNLHLKSLGAFNVARCVFTKLLKELL